MKKVICIAGKNSIAINVLKYCINRYSDTYDVVGITNRNDDGINSWQPSFKSYCLRNNIQLVNLEDVYDVNDLAFISVEFDRIIKTNKFKSNKLFNVHFSLLPKYKGMYPSALALLNGEHSTGVTLHVIRDGIDTGEIIGQKEFIIDKQDNCLDVYKKLLEYGTKIVVDNIDNLLNNNYTYTKQDEKYSTYYSSDAIDYSDLRLNTKATAYQIYKQVKAFSFRPYQLLSFNSNKIIDAFISNETSIDKPGTILEDNDLYIKISSVDYNVILYKDVLDRLLDAIRLFNNDEAKRLCICKRVINEFNNNGWTPLIVATYFNNIKMVDWLLNNGADYKAVNNNGTNLLMYAKDAYINSGDNTLYKLYKKLGLNEELEDYRGHDLYYYLDKENIDLKNLTRGGLINKCLKLVNNVVSRLYALINEYRKEIAQ